MVELSKTLAATFSFLILSQTSTSDEEHFEVYPDITKPDYPYVISQGDN